MKRITIVLVVRLCALGFFMLNPPRAGAQTNDDLKALQDLLRKQGEQIQELLKARAEDQQKIQRLEQLMNDTRQKAERSEQAATNAQQKAEETQKNAAEVATRVEAIQSAPSEEASAKHNVVITGYADALYDKQDGKNGSFLLGSFNPIVLFRASDKVLFEGELEFSLASSGETDTELEYAQVDYAANDYLTVIAGKFLLPLGQFPEKLHPAWINKMPTLPFLYTGAGMLMHDDGILPFGDVGVQGRGAMHLGQSPAVLTYSAYLVNGPTQDPDTGKLSFMNGGDFNGTPSGGGRLAVFYPWSAYHDIEVGVSGQTGTWDQDNKLWWSAAVLDASLHLGPYTELRGEYVHTWQDTVAEGTLKPRGAYAQIAYKLAGLQLELPLLNDIEAVFRYDYLNTDGSDRTPGGRAHGYALGLNYYLTNTLLVKGAYEFINGTDKANDRDRLTFEIAYGF